MTVVPPSQSLVAYELCKSYDGRPVVDRVSITVNQGEVVGLLGPNGAGKTTTFYMLVGIESPERGTIQWSGHDITRLPMHQRARRGIGYLAQESSIFRGLTVFQNLKAIAELQPLSEQAQISLCDDLINTFHLQTVRNTVAQKLSGGERRRCEIARALIPNPQIILLDEPFAGVDPKSIDEIHGLIAFLKSKGIGILITDHNVRETLQIADRAYIMVDGRIFKTGTPQEITSDPEIQRVYLGSSFSLK